MIYFDNASSKLYNDNFIQLGKNAFTFSKNFNWDKIIKKYIKLV